MGRIRKTGQHRFLDYTLGWNPHNAAISTTNVYDRTAILASSASSMVPCSTAAATVVIYLPSAVLVSGRTFCVSKIDSGVGKVTIDATSAGLIAGCSAFSLLLQGEALAMWSTGSRYMVL